MSILFWSAKLVPGKPVSVEVPEGYVLNLNKAALAGGKEKSAFIVKVDTIAIEGDKLESVLCTLRPVTKEQFAINLVFADGVPVTFSVSSSDNSGAVHLSGYFQPGPQEDGEGDGEDMDMCDDECGEDEDDDEDDEDDEPRVVEVDKPVKKVEAKKAPEPVKKGAEPAKKMPPAQESSSEEESEDEEEVDEAFLKKMLKRKLSKEEDSEDEDDDEEDSEDDDSEDDLPPVKVQKTQPQSALTVNMDTAAFLQKHHFVTSRFRESGTSLNTHIDTVNQPKRISAIQLKVEETFSDKMQRSSVPLLKDFDTYAHHLPVRRFDPDTKSDKFNTESRKFVRLYEVDYFARPADIKLMSETIDKPAPDSVRSVVIYLSAPGASGKTASVLPAFLASEQATHYLYMPYDNNGGNSFKASPYLIGTTDPEIAMKQGAAFMVQCVKNLLEGKGYGPIQVVDEALLKVNVQDYANELEAYIVDKLGTGVQIWFHVDEHGKMIRREYDDERRIAAAAFSRGAMEVLLSSVSRAIATYVKPPTEISPMNAGSSTVCRFPVGVPPLDIDQAMRNVPELNIGNIVFKKISEQRLWSTLRVRLAMKIKKLGMVYVFHRRGHNQDVEKFLADFQKIVKENNSSTKKLTALNNLCAAPFEIPVKDEDAARLLVGVKENNANSDWIFQKRVRSIVVVEPDRLITSDFRELLKLEDPTFEPYNTGRSLFFNVLHNDVDLLSRTPLEYAYFWALACNSAVDGTIYFNSKEFNIKCQELVKGRLFAGNSPVLDKVRLAKLKKNVIYYADEPKEHEKGSVKSDKVKKYSHPIADLFFVTEKNELVLVDITGGNKDVVETKLTEKAKWLKANNQSGKKLILQNGKFITKIQCIILAPNFDGKVEGKIEKGVELVCGEDAIALLGGLGQIFTWLVEDKKPNTDNLS